MTGLTIRHERGLDGLRRLERDWRAVTDRMDGPRFHHRFEWHLSCAEAAPDASGLHVIVTYDGGTPLAILPLWRGRDWSRGVPVRTLGQPDYDLPQDAVAAADPRAIAALERGLAALRAGDGPAHDVVHLEHVRSDGPIAAIAGHLPHRLAVTQLTGAAADLDCTAPYDELLARTSWKHRRRLRAGHRRLAERGDVRLTTATTPADLGPAYDRFLAVEASGWKAADPNGAAVALDPEVRALYGAAVRHFGAVGSCAIHLLWVGDRCAAALYVLRSGGTWATLKIGYNEAFARGAPGHILLASVIEQACGAADTERVDFVGSPEWTAPWRPARTPVLSVSVFSGTWRSRLVRFGRWGARAGEPRASVLPPP